MCARVRLPDLYSHGILSDRAKQRGTFVGGLLLLALVGFVIAIASEKPGAKYAGIFIAASGIFLPA